MTTLTLIVLIFACEPLKTPDPTATRFLACIVQVESSWNSQAYNKRTDAAGYYQIRPIYVRDVNRILGYERFKVSDRWNGEHATQMVCIYLNHYGEGCTLRELAAIHFSGPRGAKLLRTSKQVQIYVDKVMRWYYGR